MYFSNVVRWLQSNINKPPLEQQAEFRKAVRVLSEGKAYLTRRTYEQPYCKVIFYDEVEDIAEQVRDGVFNFTSEDKNGENGETE